MLVGCGTETAENVTTKSVAQTTVSVSKEQTTQKKSLKKRLQRQ